ANRLNFMSIEKLDGDRQVIVKIRYNHQGSPATIRMISEDVVECIFEEPQRAITPGQAVVFYEEEYVLGGGTILGSERPEHNR
ncbi:MAG: tRNA-uridine 2-sulfurtransferase, partial [Clostridiales bacterium]|nr:tRNA-uridine 2-sulfurtransferase [Clostridiales bacterium]